MQKLYNCLQQAALLWTDENKSNLSGGHLHTRRDRIRFRGHLLQASPQQTPVKCLSVEHLPRKLCESGLLSDPDRQSERCSGNEVCKVSEVKHLGMGFNQDRAEQSPTVHEQTGSLGKVQSQHWHNQRRKACIRVRLVKITLSGWSLRAPNARPCWQIKLQCLDSVAH